MRNLIRLAACAILASTAIDARADVLDDWTDAYLDAVRQTGGGPGPLSRAAAMYTTAMYDAFMAVERTHKTYLPKPPLADPVDVDAAMAAAAHAALSDAFPALTASFDALLDAHLSAIPDGPRKTAGVALGQTVGGACVANRASDDYLNLASMPYVEGGAPGDYKATPPDFTTPPHGAGWGTITSWTLSQNDQFRPTRFAAMTMAEILASPEYAAQLNEVKDLGALISPNRTQEQTEIGFFWANDVNGTYKPPGHLLSVTREVAQQHALTLAQRVRLNALVGLAIGDAAVVAWDAKYNTPIDLWRPVSGIREADTDDNPLTDPDALWEPLNPFSPTFPAYVSGHATFGATHAAVMAHFFGTDSVAFTITSEDPFYAALFGRAGAPPRSYTSFSQAAIENWRSRVYIGVHWDWDGQDAYQAGSALGQWISSHFLKEATPCPGDVNGDGAVDFTDLNAILVYFGQAGPGFPADLNGDEAVGFSDLNEALVFFGQSCAP